jgi:glycosyltransferase involved in cell wall biosynthesis
VIGAPITLGSDGPQSPIGEIASGYFLCISRLLAYKNVASIAAAFRDLPNERLVIVGTGPEEQRLRRMLPANVRLLQHLNDREMRWLYANCAAVVAAAYEDYGLTPLEGASFGRPCAVLRWGGFLDTVAEGRSGLFFDSPSPDAIRSAIHELRSVEWDARTIRAHAAHFSEQRFKERLRQVTDDELGAAAGTPPRRT